MEQNVTNINVQSISESSRRMEARESSFDAFRITSVVVFGVVVVLVLFFVCRCAKWCGDKIITAMSSGVAAHHRDRDCTVVPDHVIRNTTVERFLIDMTKEKPLRFTPEQLAGFTRSYATRLGAGGFGTVYRGTLPNGLAVAVKVLHRGLHASKSEEQFMAEMRTIGRTHHINLIKLYGYCYVLDDTCALVYEFMENGDLDNYLTACRNGGGVSMPTVAAVATGVAKGLRYLHEECQHKIVHYDIKPGNVLLDGSLTPKVADFGLAYPVNRADTHISLSGWRGTRGYAAPEMRIRERRITEKCDVYSFGMLLLKIVEHGSSFHDNADAALDSDSSQQWFPMVAWTRYEAGELMELVVPTIRDDQQCRELAERMCMVAFWCVQQRSPARPWMSTVVKMLEGEMGIDPPPNPF
ncbi:G-type lectin S-receptor-like serine/threonine-protein kinase At1g34300 [Triticum dicoccoides]|uniref:G-type lectin S-receptor-like serine/threonine-protein kinase At1g34300 n=1 Tax=Triticum dicoccoides TaxID=85692 RepID=UPI000E7B4738|nr:G-type lectin S-receptor-like serine/threonine-protein kinase At1g34300 [Triticum dicoccoides]